MRAARLPLANGRARRVSLLVPEARAEGLRLLAREFRARHRLGMAGGGWRRLSPSTELLVDLESGARCAIRDSRRSGAERYLWTPVTGATLNLIGAGGAALRGQAVASRPPHSRQSRILTICRGEVYDASSQAGPGNDINAGSMGSQKAPTWSPASLVCMSATPAAFRDNPAPNLSGAAHPVARARLRRCLAFGLAFRLLARIVLLDLAVLITRGSDLAEIGPFLTGIVSGECALS
jgi:hypothetical protein